ncbi:MAG: hypothetical protein LBI13_05695 [Streptococcaceae bacterium]|nr:hypothetical protein [Streptococcaceae bacterium]
MKKILTSGLIAMTLLGSAFIGSSTIHATHVNPAPYPIWDDWYYGVKPGYYYSNYYVQNARIGSIARVTNTIGASMTDAQYYGAAYAQVQQVGAPSYHWDYFYF